MRANKIDRQMDPGEQTQDRWTDRSIEESNLGQMDRWVDGWTGITLCRQTNRHTLRGSGGVLGTQPAVQQWETWVPG